MSGLLLIFRDCVGESSCILLSVYLLAQLTISPDNVHLVMYKLYIPLIFDDFGIPQGLVGVFPPVCNMLPVVSMITSKHKLTTTALCKYCCVIFSFSDKYCPICVNLR